VRRRRFPRLPQPCSISVREWLHVLVLLNSIGHVLDLLPLSSALEPHPPAKSIIPDLQLAPRTNKIGCS
jgi:hypothetical protein